MKEKKYIICNYADANWGKTETLLAVIDLLKKSNCEIIKKGETEEGDQWYHFKFKNEKEIVISTLGDPDSKQSHWLKAATKTGAKVIVTASRARGITRYNVENIADKHGYSIIKFSNFHFEDYVEDLPIIKIRKKEAKKIVEVISILLNS